MHAGERVNTDQVLACLDREGSAAACEGTLMAPCAHMAKAGFLRACTYRLRVRWQEQLDNDARMLIETLPGERSGELRTQSRQWARRMAQDCARDGAGRDPKSASIRRNRCRIRWIADVWAALIRQAPGLFGSVGSRVTGTRRQ